MLVTELDMNKFFKYRQPSNAWEEIVSTKSDIFTPVIAIHPKNAYCLILVTPSGIIKLFTNYPFIYNLGEQYRGFAGPFLKSILHQLAISLI